MCSRTLSSFVIAVSISIVLVAPTVSLTDQPRHARQVVGASFHPQVADGGPAVPPYPPKSYFRALTADGGAPVPPYPQPPVPVPWLLANPTSTLLADGGAPVPPYPQPPVPVPWLLANPK